LVFARLLAFSRDTGQTSEDGGGVFQMYDVRQGGGFQKSVFARTSLMDDHNYEYNEMVYRHARLLHPLKIRLFSFSYNKVSFLCKFLN